MCFPSTFFYQILMHLCLCPEIKNEIMHANESVADPGGPMDLVRYTYLN